jgi:hypothetical protein
VSEYFEDLSQFRTDPCWMVTLLAKDAPVGVILRRGPTRWWHVTLRNTKRDEFESGQWFHGRIYPEKASRRTVQRTAVIRIPGPR